MAIFSTAKESAVTMSTAHKPSTTPEDTMAGSTHSKSSLETADTAVNQPEVESEPIEVEFAGDVQTDNTLPSLQTLKKIENLSVLDQDGKAILFKNLYTGPNVARRVLVIFIRHFFCGNCQEYIRTLNSSITPASLLALPIPTFIVVVGHGDPSLIPMYQRETSCPFPIYADPTKKLYDELGMMRTLDLGPRPEYQRKQLWSMMLASFVQSLKMLKGGKALKGGDYHQVGGEFLFEPIDLTSPVTSPEEQQKELGDKKGEEGMLEMGKVEEKHVTWCHRMRNTRDHAEIPELMEVLGFEGENVPHGVNEKRWQAALSKRKGTGFSTSSASTSSASDGRESASLSHKLQELDDATVAVKVQS
ncbi:hypothetical protein EG329_007331 [Mollisiaceae sp. DMI_Dod_QoI]|nr:hypothetical protein EG329_007331 [Helotiales sp. DMI_Dod_QoI]